MAGALRNLSVVLLGSYGVARRAAGVPGACALHAARLPILMFSYLHDRMHIRNFWMTRVPLLRSWFLRARRLHDIHHRSVNSKGFMNTNFGMGFTFLTGSCGPWPKAIAGSIGRAARPPSGAMDWRKWSFCHCAAAAKRCFIRKLESKRPRLILELLAPAETLVLPRNQHRPQRYVHTGTSLPVRALPGMFVHSLGFELCNLEGFATSN